MYHHILVPLDATELSIQVVGGAVALARPLGARITFFHVVEQSEDALAGDLELLRVTSSEVYDYARNGRARELLAKAEAGASAFGVPCDARFTHGRKPAPAIVGQRACRRRTSSGRRVGRAQNATTAWPGWRSSYSAGEGACTPTTSCARANTSSRPNAIVAPADS